eukprot:360098-Chlamydomonas_euryale.AAC.5
MSLNNPRPSTLDPQPWTLGPQPSTPDLLTLDPQPSTLDPGPPNPGPWTAKPWTLDHWTLDRQTLDPGPLNPGPWTAKPWTLDRRTPPPRTLPGSSTTPHLQLELRQLLLRFTDAVEVPHHQAAYRGSGGLGWVRAVKSENGRGVYEASKKDGRGVHGAPWRMEEVCTGRRRQTEKGGRRQRSSR